MLFILKRRRRWLEVEEVPLTLLALLGLPDMPEPRTAIDTRGDKMGCYTRTVER